MTVSELDALLSKESQITFQFSNMFIKKYKDFCLDVLLIWGLLLWKHVYHSFIESKSVHIGSNGCS